MSRLQVSFDFLKKLGDIAASDTLGKETTQLIKDFLARKKFMRTTFKLEVKMDIDQIDPAHMEAMEAVIVDATRMVHAQAIMLAVKRAPQVLTVVENSLVGSKTLFSEGYN